MLLNNTHKMSYEHNKCTYIYLTWG